MASAPTWLAVWLPCVMYPFTKTTYVCSDNRPHHLCISLDLLLTLSRLLKQWSLSPNRLLTHIWKLVSFPTAAESSRPAMIRLRLLFLMTGIITLSKPTPYHVTKLISTTVLTYSMMPRCSIYITLAPIISLFSSYSSVSSLMMKYIACLICNSWYADIGLK